MRKDNFILTNPYLEIDALDLRDDRYSSSNSYLVIGTDGHLLEHIGKLYKECSVLKAAVDFVAYSLTSDVLLQEAVTQLVLYGAFFIRKEDNVLLDSRFMRYNCGRTKFKYQLPCRPVVYYTDADILMVSLDDMSPVPTPFVFPCLKSARTLTSINTFFLGQVQNGFSSSTLVSFNNGTPDEDTKNEIENMFNQRFSGPENAGRILLTFSDDESHQPSIQSLPSEDFSSRYTECIVHSKNEILSVFHVTESLLGILTNHSNGFSNEEYLIEASMFHKFTVQPLQRTIASYGFSTESFTDLKSFLDSIAYANIISNSDASDVSVNVDANPDE